MPPGSEYKDHNPANSRKYLFVLKKIVIIIHQWCSPSSRQVCSLQLLLSRSFCLLTLPSVCFPFYIVVMFSFADDDEDGFSLLSSMRQDGSIDLERALHLLDDVYDEYHVDELSLLS